MTVEQRWVYILKNENGRQVGPAFSDLMTARKWLAVYSRTGPAEYFPVKIEVLG